MKVILSIEGMSCSACSSALEKYLNKFIQKFICYLNFIMPRQLSLVERETCNLVVAGSIPVRGFLFCVFWYTYYGCIFFKIM